MMLPFTIDPEAEVELRKAESILRGDYVLGAPVAQPEPVIEATPVLSSSGLGMPRGWVKASEVKDVPVDFLFNPYIVAGALNLIVGEPGIGKSTWTADLAARVTRGRETIDGTARFTPSDVLVISAEDPASVIRSRVAEAGGDVDRVWVRKEDSPNPEAVKDYLGGGIEQAGARLVVIDPLMAYVKGDPFKDNEVRDRFLTPLARIAHATGAAIVFVSHPTKTLTASLIRQTAGSLGIVGAVRSALYFAPDPKDPRRRVMAHFKANYSVEGPSLDFTIGDGQVILPGVERPEYWKGQGLVTAEQVQVRQPRQPRHNPTKEAADVARRFVIDNSGYADSKDVREYVRQATGYEVPDKGSGLMAFMAAAGLKGESYYIAGKRGRAGSVWLIRDEEPETN